MSNKILDQRIKELQIELDWLDYNLKNVSGISNLLFSTEAITRMNTLGKRTYLNQYLRNPHGITSDYQRSLTYNQSVEDTIVKLRANVSNRLEKIKTLK